MKRSRRAFGEWLSVPQWDWYTTHTFKANYVSPRQADKAWYSWLNSLRVAAKAKGYTPSVYGEQAAAYVAKYLNKADGDIRFSHNLILT